MEQNPDLENSFDIVWFLHLLRRNLFNIILTFIGIGGATYLVHRNLPKKFKSTSVISIPTGYFISPLLREFIPQPSEPGEVSAQRLSLIRLALSDEFLDELGDKFNLYEFPKGTSKRLEERERLRKRIEYFPASATTVQFSVISYNPKLAHNLLEEILEHTLAIFVNERFQTLESSKLAIEKEVKSLSKALKSSKRNSVAANLTTELNSINQALTALRMRYTERHPEVAKLRDQAIAMQNEIFRAGDPGGKDNDETISPNASPASVEALYNDLYRKLKYLNVVLDIKGSGETSSVLSIIQKPTLPIYPFFPNPQISALFGIITAVVLSSLFVFLSEWQERNYLKGVEIAERLGTDYLGELPLMAIKEDGMLLDYEERKRLPMSAKDKVRE
jgi:uncharacterized protein involved in exopolysaccharide biosynthesis